MEIEFQSKLELISFLNLHQEDFILEISGESPWIAPLLKNMYPKSTYKVDVCLAEDQAFETEVMSCYERVFFLSHLQQSSTTFDQMYHTAIIPSLFNQLSKEEGINLIHELLKRGVEEIYLVVDHENGANTWILSDFKDFDVSFFNLKHLPSKLIKIYATHFLETKQPLPLVKNGQKLSILYILPHQNVTGGLKMLYTQMKALQQRGHRITVLLRGAYDRVVPNWITDFTPDQEFVLQGHETYTDYLSGIDVVFAGFYNQIKELMNANVPILYWEQGHEFLYGDVGDQEKEKIIRASLQEQFKEEIYYATDSVYVHDIVKARFNQESYVLPVFIDTERYYPVEREESKELRILLVGNPMLSFKGFVTALQVLVQAWHQGFRFKVTWACQVQPTTSALPFEVEYVVNASQLELANLYRQSDILLSCSIYEGCPLPPLEAMASGVAVVCTNCGGINQYAKHEQNALIASSNTIEELTEHLKRVLTDSTLRAHLVENGLKTAEQMSPVNGACLLEDILHSTIHQFKEDKKQIKQTKKVKILFLIGTLLGGGAEKVLLNLVKGLDQSKFDITVQTRIDQGIYIDEIKKYATYKTIYRVTAQSEEEANALKEYYTYLETLTPTQLSQEVIDQDYDIEVAFLEDQSTRIIAYSPNKHAKKIAWVHTDLMANRGADFCFSSEEEHKSCYEAFDEIVCVSEGAKKAFIEKFGIYDHVHVIYNPIDEVEIKEKAALPCQASLPEEFKIVSVGRLTPEKGYDRLLIIQQKLKELGVNCQLIIIGEGVKRQEYEDYIRQNQLEDCVTLMGYHPNPYQLVNHCQLFICSSYVEGLSSAVIEALILGIPIIATDCAGNRELLKDGEYGFLVENTLQALYDGVINVLFNTMTYLELKQKSQKGGEQFSYHQQLSKIQSFLLTPKE